MDLRQLRTFVTIAELGTVSRAATHLRVAQPALSRQIADLESDLGIKLFDRVRRRLVVTTEGKLLLSECRGALNAVSAVRERAQLLQRPDAGVLKVAATPQTIDGVLSVFLARYAKQRPNVQVALFEAVGAELVSMVDRGECHLAVTTAGTIEPNQHILDTIWFPPLEFVAACNPAKGFSHLRKIDVRALGSRALLLLNKNFAVREAFDAACRVAEFKPNITFESRTPHTLLALAEAGLGTAVVPSVLPTHRYDLQVVSVTYRGKPLKEGYGLIFDKRRSRPPAAEEFGRMLERYVREVFPISRPSRLKGGKAGKRT
jgi:DNA-binding transcriptional LysR family regulator